MTRSLVLLLISCGPLTPEDFHLPPGPPQNPDTSTGTEPCEFLPGEVHGPCLEDETCQEGLLCLPSLGNTASVCVAFCDQSCGEMICEVPGSVGCNPAGLCTMQCKGAEDTESCLAGQVCAQGGDTAPWECFWSKG